MDYDDLNDKQKTRVCALRNSILGLLYYSTGIDQEADGRYVYDAIAPFERDLQGIVKEMYSLLTDIRDPEADDLVTTLWRVEELVLQRRSTDILEENSSIAKPEGISTSVWIPRCKHALKLILNRISKYLPDSPSPFAGQPWTALETRIIKALRGRCLPISELVEILSVPGSLTTPKSVQNTIASIRKKAPGSIENEGFGYYRPDCLPPDPGSE